MSYDNEEKYSFTWQGKKRALQTALTPSIGTLIPSEEESVDWEETQNLFIEGDNLEVLKLLQKSYTNKIKMIYIDPPYNTGKNRSYKDKFTHSEWLNMMYPRLKLSRMLLKDDGVIFISIDDHEVANLRKICDEIFGEENFVAQFIWKKRTGSNDAQNNISIDHDYILTYSKSSIIKFNGIIKNFIKYKNPDNDIRGSWIKDNLTCNKTASERPTLFYPIKDPNTNIEYECNPNNVWRYSKKYMQELIQQKKIIFPFKGKGKPYYKRHLSEVRSDKKPFSSMINTVINAVATKETREILAGQYFDYPKSTDLIKQLLKQGINVNGIVLDFFAGSCTTAHAVLDLNKEDNGNRKFIMVQLPEPCDKKSEALKAGYKNIADIGKERIRRVIKKIKEENPKYKGDLGFKVFKLDSRTTNTKA